MDQFIQKQLDAGAYANVSEVVRAGLRMLMEKEGARQFYVLKSELETAVADAEKGNFTSFDPKAYEPDAF